jgi:hypothetical protein
VGTSLDETFQKVQASLLPAIESAVTSQDFSKRDMLDFLNVKNSLMVSYMIDLTVYIKNKNNDKSDEKNLERLKEMTAVLFKMRGLDKKLRYQIEKLLNSSTSASTFASSGEIVGPEDPLQFRPNLGAMDDEADDASDSGDDSDSADQSGEEAEDDDIQAARATLSLAKERKKNYQRNQDDDDDEDGGIYHAPRLAAVPYTHDLESKQKEREKRQKRRLRATELAQTLRAEYTETPEQEDIHGGSDYGKQRVAARRLAEREAEKTRAEEEGMIRLITSRKDKKEKKRLMRMESSNLSAIADLSNLVRETRDFGRKEEEDDDFIPEPPAAAEEGRYFNGKRQRNEEIHGNRPTKRQGKVPKAKNALQSALYATEGNKKKKKSKRKK